MASYLLRYERLKPTTLHPPVVEIPDPAGLPREIAMKQISSMMAGTVIDVLVKTGDQVADGQEIAVLESMKMQMPVQADQSGKVVQVKVATGDFVNEGDALLVLE